MTQKPEGFVEHCVHGVILGVCLHCANAALRSRLAKLEAVAKAAKEAVALVRTKKHDMVLAITDYGTEGSLSLATTRALIEKFCDEVIAALAALEAAP